MSLQTPLSRVLGLGSAKEGVEHWWWQRLTAVALVPLSIWFAVSAICLTGSSYHEARIWVNGSLNMTLLIAFVGVLLHHAQLGLQVVIEDYVHSEAWKLSLLLAVKFLAVFLFVGVIVRLFLAA
jgi:succinate dehydrogenase / fumarate reductase membrane anchor subunit